MDNGLEELCFLTHQVKLLFQFFDTLLRRKGLGIRHRGTPLRSKGSALTPVLPTMFTQPHQHGRPSLNAIPLLSLPISKFAFFDLINDRQFKSQ